MEGGAWPMRGTGNSNSPPLPGVHAMVESCRKESMAFCNTALRVAPLLHRSSREAHMEIKLLIPLRIFACDCMVIYTR
jgi:hypothetical protein